MSDRLQRMLGILTRIQSSRDWNAQRLAAEFGVAERTVYRDIAALNDAGLYLDHDPDTGGYHARRDVFLPPVHLTAEEALCLAVLCEHVGGGEQIACLDGAWRAVQKVQACLPEDVRRQLEQLTPHLRIETGPGAPPGDERDVYDRVRRALANRRALDCRYDSASSGGEGEPFRFHPYALLFSVRAWYAIGLHLGHHQIRTLKLARFTRATPSEDTYEIPADFSLRDHLGNAWRLIPGKGDHEVEIEFDREFAPTVVETHWHRTQQIEERPDGSAIFRCRVSGLDEIVWWALSMGPHCRVLNPPQLAERVATLARETASQYDSTPTTARQNT